MRIECVKCGSDDVEVKYLPAWNMLDVECRRCGYKKRIEPCDDEKEEL